MRAIDTCTQPEESGHGLVRSTAIRHPEHLEASPNSQPVANPTICGASGPHGERMGEQPPTRLPQPQTSSSLPNQHDTDMPQHHKKTAPPGPAHHSNISKCQVYLYTWQLNRSSTRCLKTILSASMKELSRSCGWRAPRRVIQAGSGGLAPAGGGEVRVVQARPTHPLAVEVVAYHLSAHNTVAHS